MSGACTQDALAKAKQLWESVQRFARGSQEQDLASRFQVILCVSSHDWDCDVGCAECAVKVMRMDGEPAEQLCPQFFKRVASCDLRCNFRCFAHAAQRSLENCLQGDERVSLLIQSLISRYRYSDGASNMRGFARGVKNSRTRAEGRGTTVYASASILCWKHRRCFC